MSAYADLEGRLEQVRAEIRRAGGTDAVRIVAVTKTHPVAAVRAGVSAGLVEFAENYADELVPKAEQVLDQGLDVRWHYIGAIQRRRLRHICRYVSVIETVSREVELESLSDLGYEGELLVQVAPSGHPTGRNGADAEQVSVLVARGWELGLNVVGLMGMALPGSLQSAADYFAQVRRLGEDLHLREYSMGMSGDYQVGVAQGATMVRLGSALFGVRSDARATKEQ